MATRTSMTTRTNGRRSSSSPEEVIMATDGTMGGLATGIGFERRMPSRKRNRQSAAIRLKPTAAMSIEVEAGAANRHRSGAERPYVAEHHVETNQIARLRMTPTTAAVMAVRAPDSALLDRSRSLCGAPRKISRNCREPHSPELGDVISLGCVGCVDLRRTLTFCKAHCLEPYRGAHALGQKG
jgi:hypothetical protein